MPIGIGSDSYVEGAIMDKNVRIGHGGDIRPFPRARIIEGDNYVVRDGIVVIPKNAVLPNGTCIGPTPNKD